jgi:hypothetical protein
VKRFGAAVEASVETIIDEKVFHRVQALHSIHSYYAAISRHCASLQEGKLRDYEFVIEISSCFERSAKLARSLERSIPDRVYSQLFKRTRRDNWTYDTLGPLVDNVCEGFLGIANDFKGHGDVFWSMAHSLLMTAFPRFSDEPNGMTPSQQRLAMKLVEKVRDNVNGYYPAITRVLLATIGPYNEGGTQANRTAFNLLRDAFYAELKSLRVLAARDPARIQDYLPENVAYEIVTDTLVHTYSDGATTSTSLRQLSHLIPLDLTHDANLHLEQPPPERE